MNHLRARHVTALALVAVGLAVCFLGMAAPAADNTVHMIICTMSGATDLGALRSASPMSPLSCPYCASLLIAIAAAVATLILPNRGGSTTALDL